MERLTKTSDRGGVALTFDLDITCEPSEIKKILKLAEKLKDYEDLGYTPEELKLCFDPPEVLYEIGNETDEEKVHPIYPVDGEQIEYSKGEVYWNCRDGFGDYVEMPLSGLHKEYFLNYEEAEAKLKGVEEKESKDVSAWKNHIMNRFMREE
jgi:hypothetical protein